MIDERQLVARAKKGDAAAFEVLVTTNAQYVYNLALRVVGNAQEAEDMAQETFLRAWRALPKFRGQAKFSTWLYRIVTNQCYNRLPGLKKELNGLDTDASAMALTDEAQHVEKAILSTEMKKYVHRAIENLPDSYRLLITLRHVQGLSYQEICQATGMPLGTVKTGIFRARQILKTDLLEYKGQ